jgi:hypothetical protein
MKTTLLLSALAVSLISATPSFAQQYKSFDQQYRTFDLDSTYPSYSSEFGFPSYAGAGLQPTFGSSVQFPRARPRRARPPRARQIR